MAEKSAAPLIYKQMAKIMAEVGAISKDRKNQAQGYNFRGVDDVYQALQLIMAKHGVIAMPTVLSERTEDRTTKAGSALIYRIMLIRYDFYAEDGSSVPATVVGEGMDSGDKASNKAMSVADKYSLLQAYKIPTAEAKDPENDSHEVAVPVPQLRQTTSPIYLGKTTADQNKLIPIAARFGITSVPDLKALSKTCEGLEFGQLEAATKEWLEIRKQQEAPL